MSAQEPPAGNDGGPQPVAAAVEVRPGSGMPVAVLVLVVCAALAATAIVGALVHWNALVMSLTVILSGAVVGLTVWRSQRDLLQFHSEHKRWPRSDELDAWNHEMHGRREKAGRIASARGNAKAVAQAYRNRVAAADNGLKLAQRQHADAQARAKNALAGTNKAYADAVAQASAGLEAWKNPGRGSRIAAIHGLELYQHAVVHKRGTLPLLHSQATVAGNLLTMNAGGVQEVLTLQEKDVPGALEFASQLTAAAGAELSFEQQRPAAIQAAEQYLKQVVADTAAIVAAESGVAAVAGDPQLLAAIQSAEQAVAAAKDDTAAQETAQAQLKSQEESAIRDFAPGSPSWEPRAANGARALVGIIVVASLVGATGAFATAPSTVAASCPGSRSLPQRYTEPGALSMHIQFVQTGCSVGIASIELYTGTTHLARRVVFNPPLPAGSLTAKTAEHWNGTGSFRGTSQLTGTSVVLSMTQEGTYKATASVILTEAQGGPSRQWATDATASTQLSDKWSAAQATGAPAAKAWAPSSKEGTSEWLELSYAESVIPTGINIWESYGPGFITKVEAFDQVKGSWATLWEGTDPTRDAPKVFSPALTKTSLSTNRIRLSVNTNVPDWNEIAAVALIGAPQPAGQVIWLQGGWVETGKETLCLGKKCTASPMNNPPSREWSVAFNTATGKVATTPDQVR